MLLAGLAAAGAAETPEEIGQVVAADHVTGTIDTAQQKLAEGDAIFRNELLEASADGRGEFRFNDDTKIALGPGARLTLDAFIYDPAKGTPSMVINLVKGAFRFLTGKLDHDAYKIKTSVANLAVRGTVFDVYVDDDGGTVVLLHDGAVDICPFQGACRRHDTVGRFIQVSAKGVLSAPLEWTKALLPGIPLKHAFPFLSRRLAIDPVRRIGSVAVSGTRVVGKVGRAAGRVGHRFRRVLRSPF